MSEALADGEKQLMDEIQDPRNQLVYSLYSCQKWFLYQKLK